MDKDHSDRTAKSGGSNGSNSTSSVVSYSTWRCIGVSCYNFFFILCSFTNSLASINRILRTCFVLGSITTKKLLLDWFASQLFTRFIVIFHLNIRNYLTILFIGQKKSIFHLLLSIITLIQIILE